jgi:hypothetical protein
MNLLDDVRHPGIQRISLMFKSAQYLIVQQGGERLGVEEFS